MSFTILGLGSAVPALRVRQEDAAAAARVVTGCDEYQATLLAELYRHTEIGARHMVPGQETLTDALDHVLTGRNGAARRDPDDRGPGTAERMRLYANEVLPLAVSACRTALGEARSGPEAIDQLVTVSCTGFAAPGFDIGLIQELGLKRSVRRTHIGFMGCHGAFNALAVASALAAQGGAQVLVCSAELCSLHYHYPWDVKRAVGNALFADGAAAVVGASAAGTWRLVANGSHLFADCTSAMTWTIGDHGFDMTLSSRVPNLIAAHLGPWLRGWLAQQGLGIDEIASWAIHPGGPRILTSVEMALGLRVGTAQVSRSVLAEYGNMSSATILFILERLRRASAPRPCVALGFGPGLVAEAMLFQ